MKTDLDILGLSDKEKIDFLERRHDLIIKFLHRQIEETKKTFLPIPHPLDFSLYTTEEEQNERYRIDSHNHIASNNIATIEYILEAIKNGNESMINKIYKEKFPSNEYHI